MNAEGWNRLGEKGLIGILNDAQNLLLRQEAAQRIVYRNDGYIPYIPTQDEVYKYELTKAALDLTTEDINIWRVAQVLVRPPFSSQLMSIISVDYGIKSELRQHIQPMEFNGIEYFRFHQAKCTDALYGGNPWITFPTNPGVTVNDFYLLCYADPAQIISEAINPEIPEQYHYTIFLPTALALLEAHQNGNWAESMAKIDVLKKNMLSELNEGDQGEVYTITRIED